MAQSQDTKTDRYQPIDIPVSTEIVHIYLKYGASVLIAPLGDFVSTCLIMALQPTDIIFPWKHSECVKYHGMIFPSSTETDS